MIAVLADGLEFLDLFRLRDELEDALEAGPQERAIEGRDNDDLSSIGCLVRPFHYLKKRGGHLRKTYIREELTLVDANYVKLTINIADLFESLGTQGLHSLPIGEGVSVRMT